MANWDRQLVGSAPQVMLRVELWEESWDDNANTSWVRYRLSFLTSNGSRTGSWDYWLDVDGARRGGGSFGGTHSGWQTVVDGGFTAWHDANGYRDVGANGWGDVYYGSGSTGGAISLRRTVQAPQGIAKSVDQVSATTVRFGRKQDSNGRGTSSANRVYYRLDNAGGWSQTADQGGTGWKYDTITLLPNRMYGYFSRHWNNNGDTGDTGVDTFVTLANATETSKDILATSVSFVLAVAQGYRTTTGFVQYRKQGDTSWINSTTGAGATPTVDISGLLPNTTYEYRLAVTTTDGTWTGSTQTFTTLPAGKLVYPNGDVKNAIPRLVFPNGDVEMININLVD